MVWVPSARLLVVTWAVRVTVTGGAGGPRGGGWPCGGAGGGAGGGGSTTTPSEFVVVMPIELVKTSKNSTVPVGVVGCNGSKEVVRVVVNVTGDPTCCVGRPVVWSNGESEKN